jgi:ArsR family transcriptional regulator
MLDRICVFPYICFVNISADMLFRTLADPTRLRALVLLVLEGELCVCELTHALGESQPKISRHLAQLRENGLVADRRAGQWVYYQINPAMPEWAKQVLTVTVMALADEAPHQHDRQQLCAMPNRPGARCCA